MRTGLGRLLGLGAMAGALLTASAVGAAAEAGPMLVQSVPLGGAAAARVEVELEAGRLRLAGGSLAGAGTPMPIGELLRAEFTVDAAAPAPRVDYVVEGDVGRLRMAQEGDGDFAWPWDEEGSRWDLYLNPIVPTELDVEVGAGESELSLGGLSLTRLDVTTGAGETTLDFAGDWRSDLAARVEGGTGELTLRLPRQVGVRVEVNNGAGDVDADDLSEVDGVYVNEAYGTAPVTIEIRVEHGAGDVELELVG